MTALQLFPDTVEGRRRGVLFAFAVIAGLLSIAATVGLLAVGQALPLAIFMTIAGVLSLAFAGLVYAGWFDDLTTDEQLLWNLAR